VAMPSLQLPPQGRLVSAAPWDGTFAFAMYKRVPILRPSSEWARCTSLGVCRFSAHPPATTAPKANFPRTLETSPARRAPFTPVPPSGVSIRPPACARLARREQTARRVVCVWRAHTSLSQGTARAPFAHGVSILRWCGPLMQRPAVIVRLLRWGRWGVTTRALVDALQGRHDKMKAHASCARQGNTRRRQEGMRALFVSPTSIPKQWVPPHRTRARTVPSTPSPCRAVSTAQPVFAMSGHILSPKNDTSVRLGNTHGRQELQSASPARSPHLPPRGLHTAHTVPPAELPRYRVVAGQTASVYPEIYPTGRRHATPALRTAIRVWGILSVRHSSRP